MRAKARFAAAMVKLMSSSVCWRPVKPASNWLGARYTPSSSMARWKRANLAVSAFADACSKFMMGPSQKKKPNIPAGPARQGEVQVGSGEGSCRVMTGCCKRKFLMTRATGLSFCSTHGNEAISNRRYLSQTPRTHSKLPDYKQNVTALRLLVWRPDIQKPDCWYGAPHAELLLLLPPGGIGQVHIAGWHDMMRRFMTVTQQHSMHKYVLGNLLP